MIKKKVVKIPVSYKSMVEREITKLLLEQDYELASLYFALKLNNQKEVDGSKSRLKEIHVELKRLKMAL